MNKILLMFLSSVASVLLLGFVSLDLVSGKEFDSVNAFVSILFVSLGFAVWSYKKLAQKTVFTNLVIALWSSLIMRSLVWTMMFFLENNNHYLWRLIIVIGYSVSLTWFPVLSSLQYINRNWFIKNSTNLFEWCLIVMVSLSVSFSRILSWCGGAAAFDFDSQNYLTWTYSAANNYLPYKDVFYWYGWFSYFRTSSTSYYLMYLFLGGMLLVGWYGLIKHLTRDRWLSIISWLAVLQLIFQVSGWDSWFRYGTGVVVGASLAIVLAQKKQFYLKILLGLLIGSLVVLLQDQGVYLTLCLVGLTVILIATNGLWTIKQWLPVWIGWLTGVSTLCLFLGNNQLLHAFLFQLSETAQLSQFAKLPFYSQLNKAGNIIIFGSIFSLATSISISWAQKNKTVTERRVVDSEYLVSASWLGLLVLFQYKNITRGGMENQFIFMIVGVVVLFINSLLKAKTNFVREKRIFRFVILIAFSAAVLLTTQLLSPTNNIIIESRSLVSNLHQSMPLGMRSGITSKSLEDCLAASLEKTKKQVPEEYQNIANWLEERMNSDDQIITWPESPIFYLLLNKKPIPIFNAYDASSFSAQNKIVSYLQNSNTKYCILSSLPYPIQDGVPNEIRSPIVYQYLLTNFRPVAWFNSFIILEKNTSQKPELLIDSLHSASIDYRNHLLITELKALPMLWGSEVPQDEKEWKLSKQGSTWSDLAENWGKDERFLEIKTGHGINSNTANATYKVALFDDRDNIATVSFYPCFEESVCTIDKKFIPLFYDDRPVTKVEINTSEVGKVDQIFYRTTNTIPPSAANLEPRGSRQR